MVDQLRAPFTGLLDPMSVLQHLNGPATCTSVKLLAIDEVAMERFPARLDRAAAEFERQPAAVSDAAVARRYAKVLPGRGQTLERARAGVPGKKRRGSSR